MKKSTKIITSVIAAVLCVSAMAIGIWAATSAAAGITANVSWTATAGIEFELEAWVVNNPAGNGIGNTSTPKSITKQVVTSATTNSTAGAIAGELNCGFYDGSDDGVNNPSDIVYTYKIKNTGSNILKVKATKTPTNQSESGTTAANHKPAVALSSSYEGTNTTTSQTSAIYGTGYNIPAGGTLEYIITLSIDNEELNISSFDAGVTFNFSVGNQTEVYIDNVSQNVNTTATTIGDYVNALDGKTYPGYYYDAELTKCVPSEDYSKVLADSVVSLYTKPATLDKLSFTSNGDGTCSVGALNDEIEGEIIIPQVSSAGDRVTSIGGGAFNYCSFLTSITIPDSVTSIGNSAFEDCHGLTSITIPDSVTSIGGRAFLFCYFLTSITIGNSVTSIGDSAFSDCSFLTSITIPDSVTSIGSSAFFCCSGLTSITIPNGVTSIGNGAFDGCSGLTSITIGNSVTSIEIYAFSGCYRLTSIYIPNSVTTISASSDDNSPFYDCSSSLKIYCGASSKPSGWGTYWNYCYYDEILSVTWGVTREQYNALYA